MDIPCYIIVFNQKKWLPQLIKDIKRFGVRPIIFDMNSTWDELKEWYKTLDIEIIYNDQNDYILKFWDKLIKDPYFIITDPDLDLSSVPDDCVEMLFKGFEFDSVVWKVGLSLEIDDLPETGYREQIIEWEKRFWRRSLGEYKGVKYYSADIDTTFVLCSRDRYQGNAYGPAIRLGRPYTARHMPWYFTREQLLNDPELKVYYSTAELRFLHWTRKHVLDAYTTTSSGDENRQKKGLQMQNRELARRIEEEKEKFRKQVEALGGRIIYPENFEVVAPKQYTPTPLHIGRILLGENKISNEDQNSSTPSQTSEDQGPIQRFSPLPFRGFPFANPPQ